MRRTMVAAGALWMGLAAMSANAADKDVCFSDTEATSLIVAILPDLVDGLARKCGPSLPENATLRGGLMPLMARYRGESDAAWPRASGALAKLGGKDLAGVSPDLMRPLLGSILTAKIAEDMKPQDCVPTDRLIKALSPLPASNVATMFVSILQLSGGKDKSPVNICPAPGAVSAAAAAGRP